MQKDLEIYKKISDYIDIGIVTSYEADILEFLSKNRDKSDSDVDKNYLNSLCSTYSVGKCFRFSRYLALAMGQREFNIIEGNLNNLNKGKFPHSWIENENHVYDVSFIGKWPKEIYYNLFNPTSIKTICLLEDKKYKSKSSNNIKSDVEETDTNLKYIDWYNYIKSTLNPNPYGFYIPLRFIKFPDLQDSKLADGSEFKENDSCNGQESKIKMLRF